MQRFLPRWIATGVGLSLIASLFLQACETDRERQAAYRARIQEKASAEVNRICALPEEARQVELEKIKEQSGVVLYCGN